MPYIVHLYNGSPIKQFVLKEQLTIGRSPDNDIQIDDPTLSSTHAVIERSVSCGYRVRDLNSTNGVLFKGKKVVSQQLQDGDVVVLGTHDMMLLDGLPERLDKTQKIRRSWIPGVYYTDD